LRLRAIFPKLIPMNDATDWKVPKWPFLTGDALLLAFAYFTVWKSPHPISTGGVILCISLSALGAIVGCLPFILDYRAFLKVVEVTALGAVSEKIENLEKIAAQISSATNQWEAFQGIVQGNSDKTVASAKRIADKMSAEVKEFSEFMKKMNDSEKAALRLEVEKMRRGETEWLQVLVRLMDYIFSLHAAVIHSGDAKLLEPITQFQNACRDIVRRIGLTSFAADPNEPFDAQRHQITGSKEKAPAGALIAETVHAGYTFQGKLLRPALVRVREEKAPQSAQESAPAALPVRENLEEELPVQALD